MALNPTVMEPIREEKTVPSEEAVRAVKFAGDNGFLSVVRRRVEEHFRKTGQRQRDCPGMYLKTGIMLAWLTSSYVLLVFAADTWWQALLLAISLGLAMAGIGFNVQHDAAHHAYSRHEWINRLLALALDLIGGSSYLWRWKHNVFHHTYVNITGKDTDIDLGALARLTPHQKLLKVHRWQHFYLWGLYGWMAIRWQLFGDFRDMITGKIGDHRVPPRRGWDLVTFIAGKLVFFTLAFALPMLYHPVWVVLLMYGVVSFVLGVVLAIVFQLAHCVEQATFPLPRPGTGRMDNPWAIHQVQTTVDFARNSRVGSWLLGGLNFQIEHHLFPRICHVNYPSIAPLVEETCQEFGVKYERHPTFRAGLRSHFRWLRRMGRPDGGG